QNFCREFGKSLQNKGWQVGYSPVIHQYVNRYEGLQNGTVGIECGPNSRESETLFDVNGQEFKETIAFSTRHFHTTGTRLLLRKKDVRNLKLENLKGLQLEKELEKLHIVVAENTTTYDKLRRLKNDYYKNVIPVARTYDVNARDRALNALDKKTMEDGTKVDAFASDAVIIQSLLKEGVKEEGNSNNKPYYQQARKAYEGQEFVAFPYQDYLSYLSPEQYVIAIRQEDKQKYLGIIDSVLSELDNPYSKLAEASKTIDKFEKGDTPNFDQASVSDKKRWWDIIREPATIPAVIAAIASIIVALLNPQLVAAFFSAMMGFISNIIRRKSSISKPRKLRLSGLVLDNETNTAIQGAEISLNTEGLQSRSTDAFGNFIFPVESLENEIRLYVNANGYRKYDRYVIFPTNTETFNIEIRLSRITSTNTSQ
ncbi:hypothetical protein, partial [Calothrix sp. UHCC 0171]|uniref:hypothetical protein n=1 Tax=Calothrix sp. UHCC 0171 TaxID=3110245 RepID=UPI002B1ED7B3